ncbi:MAG TPA: DUF998 domain-containing protein [Thermoplasmata archaeon]|nr:DUF998 domain-containing protein [Thermoplasmata archaeon]
MAAVESPPVDVAASERYGPLVHRSVHHGALLLLLGSLVFIAAMIVTQIGYGSSFDWGSSYSLRDNYISDLGATHCGNFTAGSFGSVHSACSPWHDVFNVAIVVMGILLILSVLLLRTAFPARRSRTLGLALLGIAGIGAIGVGLFPEDVNITAHTLSALLAFLGGGLALVVLGFAMFRDTRWDGFRAYSILSGLVSLVALILFVAKVYAGLGVGGMERLIVAPILLWAIVAGIHLARIPTFAPRTIPKGSAT